MKIFSAAGPGGKPKRTTGLNCLLINQFATPGLGSLMGGRKIAGSIQLLMAVAGCAMVIYSLADKVYRQVDELAEPTPFHAWLGKAGFIVFGGSWLLAWVTSISLLRQLPREEPPKPLPPIIKPPII